MDRRAFLAAAGALAAGCGGGGGGPSASGAIAPAPALRKDLLFGYYGGTSATVLEVATHANLFWAADWDPLDQMAALTYARDFKAVVLAVPAYGLNGGAPRPEGELRFYLGRLQAAGLLRHVVALYPIDEPNHASQGARSDAEVSAQNAVLRRVMSDFPELAGAKLAVIYSADSGRPGLSSYDWLGIDDYGRGCGVMSLTSDLKRALRADQRLLVVPGGADPWRQDPACFEAFAHGDAQVAAIVPFIWQSVPGNTGIRENPTRALYVDAGKKILAA